MQHGRLSQPGRCGVRPRRQGWCRGVFRDQPALVERKLVHVGEDAPPLRRSRRLLRRHPVESVLPARHARPGGRAGHRHRRGRIQRVARCPARRLLRQPHRQLPPRPQLRPPRRQQLHLEDHPQRHPPHLHQHRRRGRRHRPRPLRAALPRHPAPPPLSLSAYLRLPRLRPGHALLGIRQGLQVLSAAGPRPLSEPAQPAAARSPCWW